MDITTTEEYFTARSFVASNDSEEIAYRLAELLIKFKEMNRELACVKAQLNQTSCKLAETIEYVQSLKCDKPPATLADVIHNTEEVMHRERLHG